MDTNKIKKLLTETECSIAYDKDNNKYTLENGELKITSSTFYNSCENTNKWRDKLINEHENYPALDGLENAWRTLESDYNQPPYEDCIDRHKPSSKTPLGDFMYMVDMGFYPSPEVMLSMLDCFQHYMNMRGHLSLEEVFYGKTIRGKGNHSARKARVAALEHLDFSMICNPEKKSQVEIAEDVIERLSLNCDVDSFLRQYRRYKSKLKSNHKN